MNIINKKNFFKYLKNCPHNVPPICYCRKPQAGLLIPSICKYRIDVRQSIMVGDQTTDKTTAKRLGIPYKDAKDFFKW